MQLKSDRVNIYQKYQNKKSFEYWSFIYFKFTDDIIFLTWVYGIISTTKKMFGKKKKWDKIL